MILYSHAESQTKRSPNNDYDNKTVYLTKIKSIGFTDFENNGDDVPFDINPITGGGYSVLAILVGRRPRATGGRSNIDLRHCTQVYKLVLFVVLIYGLSIIVILLLLLPSILFLKKKKITITRNFDVLHSRLPRTRQQSLHPFRVFYPRVPLRVYIRYTHIPLLVYNLYKLLTPNYYYITSNYDVCF